MNLEAEFASATHIVFTQSGAGTLRQRISELGFSPNVICLWDNMSLGPLDCTDDARADWFVEMFDNPGWSEIIHQRRAFREDAERVTGRCFVWFSRKSAQDYCGYLEWVSCHGSKAHVSVDADKPIGSVNFLPEWLAYFSQAKVAGQGEQLRDPLDWGRLVAENAPVRKIENGRVVSAAIDCFDELLLAKATLEWKSAALMIGEVLADDFKHIRQTGDLLLANRLWELIDEERLEARGDYSSIRSVQMRIKYV